ncbi:MAG: tripartite tricarboxylate transporter TctB family protein [Parvibaculaceae bacterium]
MNRDFACGCFALAIAVGYFAVATTIHASQLDDAVGPVGLPRSYAAVMAGLALILIVRGIVQHRRSTAAGQGGALAWSGGEWVRARRAAGIIAIGGLYILLVPWLGYILSLTGLIATTAYYQGGRIDLRLVVTALLGAIFMWAIFVLLLQVPQPPGIWPSII